MFVSLNKKIIYSILFFFIISSLIFIYTFYIVYGNRIQEELRSNIQRNQQYIDLLYQNINLSNELRNAIRQNKSASITADTKSDAIFGENENSLLKQIHNEQRRIAEFNKNYDERYAAIQESVKILGISSILSILAILLFGYLMTRWILVPLNKISAVSQKVSEGNLNVRIEREHMPKFTDELDYLIITFNQMLDNLQNVISEVKEQEAFLQALIDSIPDGIRVIDENYNIIIANKAYFKQVGTTGKSCKHCYESSHCLKAPCDHKAINCPLYEILTENKTNIKVIQQFKNASTRHLSINAAPLISDKGRYIVESIRDLSDDINFSHQQKLSSLGFLSTSIAHEMKNHLGALRIIIERLLEKFRVCKPENNETFKHLELIYKELVGCIAVPERLLKLSHTNPNDTQNIDCRSALEDVIGLLDFEAKSKGISISLETAAPNLTILGNAADFKMVAINLILNAIKAMDNGGNMEIKVSQDKKDRVVISFKDNGSGIPKENINRIFEPFFSDSGNGERTKGTGLGLAISKSIVEKFGGNISVTSTLGKGSCFTLSFPSIKNLAKK